MFVDNRMSLAEFHLSTVSSLILTETALIKRKDNKNNKLTIITFILLSKKTLFFFFFLSSSANNLPPTYKAQSQYYNNYFFAEFITHLKKVFVKPLKELLQFEGDIHLHILIFFVSFWNQDSYWVNSWKWSFKI